MPVFLYLISEQTHQNQSVIIKCKMLIEMERILKGPVRCSILSDFLFILGLHEIFSLYRENSLLISDTHLKEYEEYNV